MIRLRTDYRRDPPEDVYLYRLQGSRDDALHLFREYLRKINSLRAHPELYNTITANCTRNIWHSQINPGHVPYSWKILASGYLSEYLYDEGRVDTRMSFAELKRRAYINPLAHEADGAADFSNRIRARLSVR